MAEIGSWGTFTFYVSRSSIKTFDDLKWESSVKYATHERHLKEPLLEFTGQDVESMSFTMFFSVFLGVNPIAEVANLLQTMRRTMAYTVKAYALEKINLAPEDTTEEVLQNVAVILSTPKFSVPLERGLGLAQRFLDKPIPAAQSILISEVLEAIEEFEPRAEVENVTFELGDRPGTLIPIVEVKIIDGDE